MAAHVRASWDAAGVVRVAAHVCAPRQTADMIPMSVVSRVRITILAVVHMNFCFGASSNAASAVVMLPNQRAAVDAACPVYVGGFQAATWQTAGMIPMTVISGVGITVLAVVHMRFSIGASSNAAYCVGVLPNQRTAIDAAQTVLVIYRQRASRNLAGNAYLIFLCCILAPQGTPIYRIGDNTACYHGNRYKRNG